MKSNIIYNVEMLDKINDEFSKNAVPIVGTDCTEWKGSYTGSGTTAQIFFGNIKDSSGNFIMARTVGQCVHYLETGEDLNNENYVMVRTCSSVGCTNPNHYEKQYRSKNENNENKTKPKKIKEKKIDTIPKWQLRPAAFYEIKNTYYSLDNVSYLSKKYNIDRTLVRKIMNNKAVLKE